MASDRQPARYSHVLRSDRRIRGRVHARSVRTRPQDIQRRALLTADHRRSRDPPGQGRETSRRTRTDGAALSGRPWPDVRGLSNIVRHGYDEIDAEIIWKTATTSIQRVRDAARQEIARLRAEETD